MEKKDVPQAQIFVDEVMFIQHYFPPHSLTLLWKIKQLYELITLSKMKNASGLNIETFWITPPATSKQLNKIYVRFHIISLSW